MSTVNTNYPVQVRQAMTFTGVPGGNTSTQPSSQNVNQNVCIGPTPGVILVTKQGVNINLSSLQTPGFYWIQNLDQVNFVEMGIWDPATQEFYPLLEFLPGEFWQGRLSRYIGEDIGTGSGTTPSGTGKQLRLKATGASCYCNVLVWNQ